MAAGNKSRQSKTGFLGPVSRWWEGQRNRHLVILGSLTMLGFFMLMWSIIFFFFLNGASDPNYANIVSWTWLGLLVGATILVFAAPEYIHYHGQWSILMETLRTTSRADLGRQRKESEEAAALLGSVWTARLKSHYIEQGLVRAREVPPEAALKVAEDLLIDWWGTADSRLSRWITIDILRSTIINRTIGILSLMTSVLQLFNMSFGLVRNAAGERTNTLNIWEWLNDTRIDSYPAPYFDDLSGWFVLLTSIFVLWATFPASGERPELPEEEE